HHRLAMCARSLLTKSPSDGARHCRAIDRHTVVAIAGTVAAATALGGCKVGPNYATPSAPVANSWLEIKTSAEFKPDDYATWWQTFNDPVLDSLVAQAMNQNLTLRQAGLRVIQARAQRGIAVGQFFPQSQAATGQATQNQISK